MELIVSYLPKWDHFVGAFFAFMIPFSIAKISNWLRQIVKSN
ncbi:hypothetical protein [Bacillus sp. FJAT-47783]|nr:hypothetical protein [Bacillus sp. FJAT-47783]